MWKTRLLRTKTQKLTAVTVVTVALLVVAAFVSAHMLSVAKRDDSPVFLYAEEFEFGSSFVIESTSLMLAGQDKDALGTSTSPVEMEHPHGEGHTAIVQSDWTYTASVVEKNPDSVTSGSFAAELYMSGGQLDNEYQGTVYFTQGTDDLYEKEGVDLTWDLGAGIPSHGMTFFIKIKPHQIPANLVQYTIESQWDGSQYVWIGVGGDIDGLVNPTLNVTAGDTLQITIQKGCQAEDTAPHDLHVKDAAGNDKAHGGNVNACGDQQTAEWATAAGDVGEYRYECMYHATTQLGTINVV